MTQKLLIEKEMHMGPISRKLCIGDVVGWSPETRSFSLNGTVLPDKGERWEEAIRILNTQREKAPVGSSWSTVIETKSESEHIQGEFKTDTLTMLPVLGCLKAAEEFIAKEKNMVGVWTPRNESQKEFLDRYQEFLSVLEKLPDILKRKASWDVSEINSWLKENGFDIKLNPCSGGFAVASILDMLVEWLEVGKPRDVRSARNGKTYPGVELKKGITGYENKGLYPYPIACVVTKTGEKVYMAVMDEMPRGNFGIADKVFQLKQVTRPTHITGVRFPMISYDARPDISWIEGLMTGEFYIEQAIQQTKFRMNEIGARVQSAVAMTFRCASLAAETWITIDRPFILWIERWDLAMPVFAGVFCEDVWGKPRNIMDV